MQKKTPHYLVGIDLGTTHTVVAYIRADQTNSPIQIFNIEQLVAPGQVSAKPLLPSVRYHPAEGELSALDLSFSPAGETVVIGEAARFLGAKSKGRLVTSAKSWLSHPSVDQTAAILPWGSSEDIDKVSPLDASVSYLQHIRSVWKHRFAESPLEDQDIVITVPASFDESARTLTLEAARLAGLKQVRLLEEPQAVCYDWLRRNADNLQQTLKHIHLLLICDVGGGTTDLTLIKIEQGEHQPKLTRIGVGDHLMLGGDNIDLALAHLAETRIIQDNQKLSTADLSQLIEQCRIAKEKLLAADAPDQIKVTLLGGGSRLIGNSRSATLTRTEVKAIALDGFFPLSDINDLPDRKRSGVVEFGLPYAADPAISKHIAAFLKQHQTASRDALHNTDIVPDALLLNGGVFRSQPITQRIVEVISSWRASPPLLLENSHPELAVAFGAVSYSIARCQQQLKIGGGSARSYFLLIDTEIKSVQQGICILPKGSEEGHEIILKDRQFALRLGTPVRFHLASLTGDGDFKAGDITDITDIFHSLPPLAVALGKGNQSSEITVQLAATQTEIGTVKIQCVAVTDPTQRWDVEFQIRKNMRSSNLLTEELPSNLTTLETKIQTIFGSKSKQIAPNSVKNLRSELEKGLGPRVEWPIPVLRSFVDVLLEGSRYQRRSEHHERIWLSLTGFCLRPGFGYPLDDWRVEQVWKNYPLGIQFVNETQNWSEWWTLWRRIAGGLSPAAQETIFNDISKYINPATARNPGITKQLKNRSYDDIVRLAAVLERLPIDKKIQLSEWLLKRLEKPSEPEQTWWALGRIAARVPFHGSSHNVIPAEMVENWLQSMLTEDWKKKLPIAFAATLMARMSGDRARDINVTIRQSIINKLKQTKAPYTWLDMIEQVRELDEKDEKQLFGEALPPGLKLINNS